jgi:hypothetical protein
MEITIKEQITICENVVKLLGSDLSFSRGLCYHIRDEIISVVSSYLKRQSIAKEYIRAYSEATLKELDPIAALVNQYGVENINGKMLEGLGYTPKQIGNILNQIC